MGRDGEDVREGKGRRTSASVSSEVGVVAEAWHNNRMHNGPAPASLPPAGDAVHPFCGKEKNGIPWKSTNALSARQLLNGSITN